MQVFRCGVRRKDCEKRRRGSERNVIAGVEEGIEGVEEGIEGVEEGIEGRGASHTVSSGSSEKSRGIGPFLLPKHPQSIDQRRALKNKRSKALPPIHTLANAYDPNKR